MPFEITIEKPSDIQALDLEKARKALDERATVLEKVFAEAGEAMDHTLVKSQDFKTSSEMAVYIRKMNEELSEIGKRRELLDVADVGSTLVKGIRLGLETPDPRMWMPGQSNGQKAASPLPWAYTHLYEGKDGEPSPILKALRSKQNAVFDLEGEDPGVFLSGKAVFSTTAGWAPFSVRLPRVVPDEQRPIEVTDVVPQFPTGMASIVYMEETTFTNAAAERAEAAAYPEATLALTERTMPVRSIGVSLPVTDEQLEDVEGIRAYLNGRLGFMVDQRLDSQIIVGDGNAPNLRGTLNVVGINTQAKGADNVPDAIYKAMDLVRVTGRAVPNVVIIHPNDWQGVRLLKTADGVYIWGSPSEAGPERIWGVPAVLASGITENTAVTGDYLRYSGLFMRRGLQVETGYVNDDFLKGKVTIRAGLRCAMVHFRPAAFSAVTGI